MLLQATRLITDQHGLITRRQALTAGFDDRDLGRFADSAAELGRIRRSEIERRFGFVSDPS